MAVFRKMKLSEQTADKLFEMIVDERIYTPGEIEWERHRAAEANGLELPADVAESLEGLSADIGLPLPWEC